MSGQTQVGGWVDLYGCQEWAVVVALLGGLNITVGKSLGF